MFEQTTFALVRSFIPKPYLPNIDAVNLFNNYYLQLIN